LGESVLGQRIEEEMKTTNPTVGTLAHVGRVDVRIAAKADDEAQADRMIAAMEARLREKLREYVYGVDDDTLESVVAAALKQAGMTLALVETSTGGLVAEALTAAPGGVSVLRGAWVATSRAALGALLGIVLPEEFVSAASAACVAAAARQVSGADWGLAVLGTVGAHEGVYEKESGEAWIALAGPRPVEPQRFPYGGMTEQARRWISARALDMVRRALV